MATLSGKAQEGCKCAEAHAGANTTTTSKNTPTPPTYKAHTFGVQLTSNSALDERDASNNIKATHIVNHTLQYVPNFK